MIKKPLQIGWIKTNTRVGKREIHSTLMFADKRGQIPTKEKAPHGVPARQPDLFHQLRNCQHFFCNKLHNPNPITIQQTYIINRVAEKKKKMTLCTPSSQAYGERWYWDNRYTHESAPFDWYQKYPALASLIHLYVPHRHERILVVGCGNSGTYSSTKSMHTLFQISWFYVPNLYIFLLLL